jgi:hypothetical protein
MPMSRMMVRTAVRTLEYGALGKLVDDNRLSPKVGRLRPCDGG